MALAEDLLAPETRPLDVIASKMFEQPLDILIGGHTHLERIRHEPGLLRRGRHRHKRQHHLVSGDALVVPPAAANHVMLAFVAG